MNVTGMKLVLASLLMLVIPMLAMDNRDAAIDIPLEEDDQLTFLQRLRARMPDEMYTDIRRCLRNTAEDMQEWLSIENVGERIINANELLCEIIRNHADFTLRFPLIGLNFQCVRAVVIAHYLIGGGPLWPYNPVGRVLNALEVGYYIFEATLAQRENRRRVQHERNERH